MTARRAARRRVALAGFCSLIAFAATTPVPAQVCAREGVWAVPGAQHSVELSWRDVLDRAGGRSVVLLGELHDQAEHHRWQLQTMSALFGRRSEMVLGFEMFPRRVQPVLDRWVAGELSEAELLKQSDWTRVWGFATQHYLPLFHFARMNRIPMVALNVERDLIREIGRLGADAVPENKREGIGRPEPATPEYLSELHAAYVEHGDENKAATLDDASFRRFVEGQLTWDRAMAEAINGARERYPGRQVVAVMGRGHALPGAVPRQLRALGISDAMVLLPWERDAECARLKPGIADAVFGVAPDRAAEQRPQRPILGVTLEQAEAGVRIQRVNEHSVAAEAGLAAGDLVLTVAGRQARNIADVVSAVARQAPGTWLPLRVQRSGSELEIVAKFPPSPN